VKIVLPYISRGGHNIHSPVITGGIEKFVKNLYDLFPDEIIPIEITREDRSNRRTRKIFEEALSVHKPDMIWTNDVDQTFDIGQLEWNIPTIRIIHEPLIRDVRFVDLFSRLHTFHDAGGHSLFVSQNQQEFFNKNSVRLTGRPLDTKGLINSSYSDVSMDTLDFDTHIVYDAVTIGRTDVTKNPFFIHKKLRNTGIKSCVLTDISTAQKPAQKKYHDDNIHWKDDQSTLRGLNHDDTMNILSTAGCFISTCPMESWGITVLESLSRGIPVILVTDKTDRHSSETIAACESHYVKVRTTVRPDDLAEIVRSMKSLSPSVRRSISKTTIEKHSRENYKKSVEAIIDNRMNDVPNRATLSSFFD